MQVIVKVFKVFNELIILNVHIVSFTKNILWKKHNWVSDVDDLLCSGIPNWGPYGYKRP